MPIVYPEFPVNELIKIDKNGFTAALFPQIRDAITRKMMDIYGYDIDLSAASADAQYINMEALIINNIYRALESMLKGMIPSNASGRYLDVLASFSGASRIQPTFSTAWLYIWNKNQNEQTPANITCIDKAGNTWYWRNPLNWDGQATVKIPSNVGSPFNPVPYGPLEFHCTQIGPVQALASGITPTGPGDWSTLYFTSAYNRGGDIYQTLDAGNFEVYQANPAIIGKDLESDASLRARRLQSFGERGVTVINSLKANLLNIDGIDDVWVLNNNTANSITCPDSTSVLSHNVYVCIWKNPSLNETDPVMRNNIANMIYDQLTPGVISQPADGDSISYSGIADNLAIYIENGIYTTVSWKQCKPISPGLKFVGTLLNGTPNISDRQKTAIFGAIKTYLESVRLGNVVNKAELINAVNAADLKTSLGLSSYTITDIYYCPFDPNDPTLPTEPDIIMEASKELPITRLSYQPTDTSKYYIETDSQAISIYWNISYSGATGDYTGPAWPPIAE